MNKLVVDKDYKIDLLNVKNWDKEDHDIGKVYLIENDNKEPSFDSIFSGLMGELRDELSTGSKLYET